jgi:dTDP-4-amino-4,6-dideoxygalactose transaminase
LIEKGSPVSRDDIVLKLEEWGIQTRTYYQSTNPSVSHPISLDISDRVIALPCYESLTDEEIGWIGEEFIDILGRKPA